MYGLSNSENIFDLRWPLKVKGRDQTPPKKFRNTFIPVYNRYTHSKPTQKSGWSLASCIGCCNMLSAATKLRRLALCAFSFFWTEPCIQNYKLMKRTREQIKSRAWHEILKKSRNCVVIKYSSGTIGNYAFHKMFVFHTTHFCCSVAQFYFTVCSCSEILLSKFVLSISSCQVPISWW